MSVLHSPRPVHLVPFAVASDEETAERWLDALANAGIEAELRFEDAARVGAASSVFVVPTEPTVASALYVDAARRTEAAAILIDLGWRGQFIGRPGSLLSSHPHEALAGAVLAAVGGVALALVLALRNG